MIKIKCSKCKKELDAWNYLHNYKGKKYCRSCFIKMKGGEKMKGFKIINSEVSGSKKLKFRTRKEAEDFTKRIGGDVIEIDAKNLKVKKSTKKINKTSQVFLGTNLKMPNFRL